MTNRQTEIVRAVWAAHGTAEEAVLPGLVVPDSHIEFVFHLGTPWHMQRLGFSDWTHQPAAFVYGQNRRCLRFAGTETVSVVAFRVSPVVAGVLLGRPLVNDWDHPVPLEDFVGSGAEALLDCLRIAAAADRFAVLGAWIKERLNGWDSDSESAQRLFNEVFWRRHQGTMPEVAEALGPSSRSLRRTFADYAGLAPKEVQLGGRLLTACALLREYPALNVTDVAERTGFCDHAAFTNAFTNRLGLAPVRFREEPHVFYERSGQDLQATAHLSR